MVLKQGGCRNVRTLPVEIDEELYRPLAEAAAREGKDVQAYVNEIIRIQLREVERVHQLIKARSTISPTLIMKTSFASPLHNCAETPF
jgi:hypothetical protein